MPQLLVSFEGLKFKIGSVQCMIQKCIKCLKQIRCDDSYRYLDILMKGSIRIEIVTEKSILDGMFECGDS